MKNNRHTRKRINAVLNMSIKAMLFLTINENNYSTNSYLYKITHLGQSAGNVQEIFALLLKI